MNANAAKEIAKIREVVIAALGSIDESERKGMMVWIGGKQPEESPERSVGRSQHRQARERSAAEGSTRRDGESFRAIKEYSSYIQGIQNKDKGKSKSKNWSIMVQQIGKDIKGGK